MIVNQRHSVEFQLRNINDNELTLFAKVSIRGSSKEGDFWPTDFSPPARQLASEGTLTISPNISEIGGI